MIGWIIIGMLLFCGCNKEQGKSSDLINENTIDQYTIGENDIFLYNIPVHRLGKYNLTEKRFQILDDTANLFQYSFIDGSDYHYYVSGHSVENKFELIREDGNCLSAVQVFGKETQLFPLAVADEERYYLIQTKSEENLVSEVARFENEEFNILFSTDQKIKKGVIIGTILYYTVYHVETDCFYLYQKDLSKDGSYELVRKDLVSDEVYSYKDQLLICDNEKIFNDQYEFNDMFYNFFLKDDIHLFQIDINDSGDMKCYLTNLDTHKVQEESADVINFKIEEDHVVIYAKNEIIHMTLE